jgi:hypothetical protein
MCIAPWSRNSEKFYLTKPCTKLLPLQCITQLLIVCYCLLAWICVLTPGTESFIVHWPPSLADGGSIRRTSITSALPAEKKEQLHFGADVSVTSDPLPTESKEEAYNFLRSAKVLEHFLTAGRKSVILSGKDSLMQMWKDCCEFYGSDCLPEPDRFVASETSIQFPGVTCRIEVVSGVKQLEKDGAPIYDCVVIAEKRTVTGLPPLVWIFNKLTGVSSTDDDYKPAQAKAKTRMSIAEKDDRYAIQVKSEVSVLIEFPKFLVQIFPVPKARMEEQGSLSIEKAVLAEIHSSLACANEAVLRWQQSKSLAA